MSARARTWYLDAQGATRPAVVEWDETGRIAIHPGDGPADIPRLAGLITGGFTDWHVHLALIEPEALWSSALVRVIDLGGDPEELSGLHASGIGGPGPARLAVEFAGAFLTPPGGYPSDRAWATERSIREISTTDAAVDAVAEMARAGSSMIKVASNSVAGPTFDDELFRCIVHEARAHGLPVVAHAEGAGEAVRASRLGAAALAHAPFSEPLSRAEINELAGSIAWISTLDIHGWGSYGDEYAVASANLARFAAAGGMVRYGTDMGNGATPTGLSGRELAALAEAGLGFAEIIASLTPADPLRAGAPLIVVPGTDPLDLESASPLTLDRLQDLS